MLPPSKYPGYMNKVDKAGEKAHKSGKNINDINAARDDALRTYERKMKGMDKQVKNTHNEVMKEIEQKVEKQMKKGGLVKKTAVYKLHKGEVVVPASRVKSVDAALKKDKKKPLKK